MPTHLAVLLGVRAAVDEDVQPIGLGPLVDDGLAIRVRVQQQFPCSNAWQSLSAGLHRHVLKDIYGCSCD